MELLRGASDNDSIIGERALAHVARTEKKRELNVLNELSL